MRTIDTDRTDTEPGGQLSHPVAALTGLLSTAAALAAGHAVAGAVGPAASPVVAVGNAAIDLTPHPVKDFAIRVFGVHDKLVLAIGMGLVLLTLAALVGLVSMRRRWPGLTAITVLGLVGAVAVFSRPDLGRLGFLAPVAALAAGVGGFLLLYALAEAASQAAAADPPAVGTGTERRVFLFTALGVAVGAALTAGGGVLLGRRVDVQASRESIGELVPASPQPPVPAGADFAADGTPAFITSNDDFYRVDTALVVPRLRAEDWALRVHGMVDRELTLDYDDLRRRPLVERTITLTCVSNQVGGPYISTARFVGVPLADVLHEAGVRPGADQLASRSADGWTCGTPTAVVLEPDRGALLAIGMNGEPLPVEHGFPVRMVVPGLYGYVSATKWLVELELTTFDAFDAYWISRGWAAQAPIKTMSRIDRPRDSGEVPAGRVTVAGVAWAQHLGIDGVQVRVDGGRWQPAELATEVTVDSWRPWRIRLDLPPGQHTAEVRATDRDGYTQTGERAAPLPDGATGWHSVTFTAR